jgi:uncharacterized membrane protein
MKKYILSLSACVISASSLFAAAGNSNRQKQPASVAQQGQAQMMTPPADCSKMSADEQNFASQMSDMNNKSMFCSQFTPQQRQQAMQMMGQPDASGNMMSADQAVQQVMQSSTPSTQRRTRAGGGCPVK